MPLPLTVSCFSKIQISFTFLVLAHLDSPGKKPLNGCACVCVFRPGNGAGLFSKEKISEGEDKQEKVKKKGQVGKHTI